MKKITALFLAIIIVFSFVACGDNTEDVVNETETTTQPKENKEDAENIDTNIYVDDDVNAPSDEVVVPAFVGKILDDIQNKAEYSIFFEHELIEIAYVYIPEYENGYIYNQSVEEGTTINLTDEEPTVIKLSVVYSSNLIAVPDFTAGAKLQDVRTVLYKKGFVIKTEARVDTSVEEGTVLEFIPEEGQELPFGSTVTVYYAVDDANKKAVPCVIGESLISAKNELEAHGFTVKVEYMESSVDNDGLVISQNIDEDTIVVAEDIAITIIVGIVSIKTTTITVSLPDFSKLANEYEDIYVYVGNNLYRTYSNVMMDGKTQTVEIGGSENTNFEIYIGEQMVCSGDVDFTAGEILVSNMIESEYIFTAGQN